MDKIKIDRINELARLSKERPLTDTERTEQKALREEYIQDFRRGMGAMLDNTYIQRPDGTKEKIKRK